MNRRRVLFCSLIVLAAHTVSGCAMQQEPCCASYPIKPFKAVYECKTGDAPASTQTWLSDGRGKVLLFSGKPTSSGLTTLIDYRNDTSTTINANSKTGQTIKLETPWISNGTSDETNAAVLGARQIDGHPCKGWKVKVGDAESEYWLGDDTGCYVLISSQLAGSKTSVQKLVDYKPEIANPHEFEIPRDCAVK